MNEIDRILTGLIRRTADGKMHWRQSVEDDEFLTSVDAIAAIVRRQKTGGYYDAICYQLEIFNDEGYSIQVLGAHDMEYGLEDRKTATREQERQIVHLYELARGSALKVQSTLEKLAKALEAD